MAPLLRRLLPLAAAALLVACSRAGGDALPDLSLPQLSGKRGASLASCPTAKCLTIYVAPWCGYCRAYTPHIIALRSFLASKGVSSRVVVGKDAPAALEDYAKVFGADAQLDLKSELTIAGVPHFFVTDARGRILKDVGGVPTGAVSVEEFASFFDLP